MNLYLNLYWKEFKRFLKENKKYVITGTLLLGLIFSVLFHLLEETDSEEEIEIKESSEIFETESKASFFRFYIEKLDGSSFKNKGILNELLNMDDLYNEVLLETNIDINEIINISEEKEYFEFAPIKVKVDNDSDIYTALFETGDDYKNIQLANFYYNYLKNKNLPVLESHKIFLLAEPDWVEYDEDVPGISPSQLRFVQIKRIGINLVKGLGLALIGSLVLLILREIFGKKLSFAFGYTIEYFDDLIIYDKNLNNEKQVQYFLGFPNNIKKLVLIEKELSAEEKNMLFTDLNKNIDFVDSIEYSSTTDKYEEIILIVKTKGTTREWYNKQIELLSLHDSKTKILQLNNIF